MKFFKKLSKQQLLLNPLNASAAFNAQKVFGKIEFAVHYFGCRFFSCLF